MSHTHITLFCDGLGRCSRKAASAPSQEIEILWLSIAEHYHCLLEREQRDQERLAAKKGSEKRKNLERLLANAEAELAAAWEREKKRH